MLAQKTHAQAPLLENASARLWDIGDGITCLEFITDGNRLDIKAFKLIDQAITKISLNYTGMVIGDDDQNFSLGLDMHVLCDACIQKDWDYIHTFIDYGQDVMMALKYAPFPVVGTAYGKAIGAGCTLLLHCDAIQAHRQCQMGLDEERIGLTPCLGGCKEMLLRHLHDAISASSSLLACEQVFTLLSRAKIATSVKESRKMRILRNNDGINSTRKRLLPDAKARCLALANGYTPPTFSAVKLPAAAVKALLWREIERSLECGEIDGYECRVWQRLADIISGGSDNPEQTATLEFMTIMEWGNGTKSLAMVSEPRLLELERDAFIALLHHRKTQEKIKAEMS